MSLPARRGCPGWALGGGSTAGVGGDGDGGEEVARGSGMRLTLNPQKSPYLEKCSIRLLISPFALISLLVCAAAVLLSGREGEAEEGAGRREHACAGDAPTSQGQLCVLLLASGPLGPSAGGRLSSGLTRWLRGCFQGKRFGRVVQKASSLLPNSLLAKASSDA